MGKGRASGFHTPRAEWSQPEPVGASEAKAAAQWLEMVVDEYVMRRYAAEDDAGALRRSAERLTKLARIAETDAQALVDPVVIEFLRDVSFQLALWDCDPQRPGKGTWLTLAADDLARLVTAVAPAYGAEPLR